MEYIILGATGFLGYNVAKLFENNENAKIILRKENEAIKSLNIKTVVGSFDDVNFLVEAIPNNSVVIDMIGLVDYDDKHKEEIFDVNFEINRLIVDICVQKKCRLLFVSDISCIPDKNGTITDPDRISPEDTKGLTSFYQISKATISDYILGKIKYNGLNACVFFPSILVGPMDHKKGILSKKLLNILLSKKIKTQKGQMCLVDVRDVANCIFEAKDADCVGSFILNGTMIKNDDFEQFTFKYREKSSRNVSLLCGNYLISKDDIIKVSKNDKSKSSVPSYSSDRANKALGFSQRSVYDSIQDHIEWMAGYLIK